MERKARHVACWIKGRLVVVTDRDLKAPLYFDDIGNAHAACALLNLGFEWSRPESGQYTPPFAQTVQPLILSPAPKELS